MTPTTRTVSLANAPLKSAAVGWSLQIRSTGTSGWTSLDQKQSFGQLGNCTFEWLSWHRLFGGCFAKAWTLNLCYVQQNDWIWGQVRNSQLILVLQLLGCSAHVFLDLEERYRQWIAGLLINTRTALWHVQSTGPRNTSWLVGRYSHEVGCWLEKENLIVLDIHGEVHKSPQKWVLADSSPLAVSPMSWSYHMSNQPYYINHWLP